MVEVASVAIPLSDFIKPIGNFQNEAQTEQTAALFESQLDVPPVATDITSEDQAALQVAEILRGDGNNIISSSLPEDSDQTTATAFLAQLIAQEAKPELEAIRSIGQLPEELNVPAEASNVNVAEASATVGELSPDSEPNLLANVFNQLSGIEAYQRAVAAAVPEQGFFAKETGLLSEDALAALDEMNPVQAFQKNQRQPEEEPSLFTNSVLEAVESFANAASPGASASAGASSAGGGTSVTA